MTVSSAHYLAIGALSGIAAAVASPFTVRVVEGPSMSPALNPKIESAVPAPITNDVVLVRRKRSGLTPVEAASLVGNVVCLRDPRDPQWTLIKRLVAAEGQTVVPLCPRGAKFSRRPVVLPPGRCWVESDAGFGYKDSNLFGAVEVSAVTGVVVAVVWPLSRMGFNPNEAPRRRRSSSSSSSNSSNSSSEGL